MTTRLKRKLGDLGVDLNSRKATENFCLIGTPLPPLEKSKDTGEFVPLWKQEVRDEKGRKRLHGAFTGGFSAGYFNSVGSKEGWTPSTFVSSRSERAKKQAAKPEDFMDEEDIQELKDSRMLVSSTGQDDHVGGAGPGVPSQLDAAMGLDNDPIATALHSSSTQGKDSPGMKLLKKMGWRQGQGIGPRVNLRERKRQDAQAFDPYTGVKSVGNSLDVASDDEEANKHTYPRRDTPVLKISTRNKQHGLGYNPGMSLNERLGVEPGGKQPSGPKISTGFGLGALNDADEDDIDIYESVATSRSRTAFEHMDQDQDDTIVIGKNSVQASKPKVAVVSGQTFYGGARVIPGFTLSDQPVQEDTWYAGPEVPANWKPDPRKVWDANANSEDEQKSTGPQNHRAQISATERGTILGETPASSGPRSVFDFMSEKDRERIKRIAAGDVPPNRAGTGPNSSTIPHALPPPPPPTYTPTRLEPSVAQAALRGFQPFTKDPVKQARYNTFLQSQANPEGGGGDASQVLTPYPGQSTDEFHKELEDFAKSAILFKPMSGAMAGRFTSAAVLDLGPKIHEGLHQPSEQEYLTRAKEDEEDERDKEKGREEEEKSISPKAHAARMGMYGALTRETQPWVPAKLLCKRFGVKEPEVVAADPVAAAAAGESKAGSGFTPTTFEKEAYAAAAAGTAGPFDDAGNAAASGSGGAVPSTSNSALRLPRKIENIGLGDDETQGADILTYERPSMDIFKAIFASDEEDSDDDGAGKKDDGGEGDDDDDGDWGTGTGKLKSLTQELKLQDTGPVDLATFKPTFIPREGKGKADKERTKEKEKEKKEKKERKKKKAGLVSFQLDDGDGEQEPTLGNPAAKEKERPKKKKRKEREKRREGEDDDAGMFVDQSASLEVVEPTQLPRNFVPPLVSIPKPGLDTPRQGRKRAIDFLDE